VIGTKRKKKKENTGIRKQKPYLTISKTIMEEAVVNGDRE